MNISKDKITEFKDYINLFHGIEGIYSSGRNVTNKEVSKAIEKLLENESIPFCGDTLDRERACNIIFTEEEITNMYNLNQ